jgi:hypothetical protein
MADRTVDAESVAVRIVTESAPGTAPSSGWTLALQPNPGGIAGFTRKNDTVERDPLSVYAAREKGDIVGHRAELRLTVDLTCDVLRYMAPSMFRSNPNVPGGAGIAVIRPTAVVDGGGSADSFAHAAISNALAAGILIRTQGFANSANNAVHKVESGGSTTSTPVPTGTLVAETGATTPVLPGNQIMEVCGVEGAEGDIQINASNHLISSTLDFTTLGLVRGCAVILGDAAIGTRFATLPTDEDCVAWVKSTPTANLIELEDHTWTPAGADNGSGKTIRILFGERYANRARNDATFNAKPTHNLEKEDQNAATNNTVAAYTYANGCALAMWKLTGPLKGKITAEFSFIGLNIANPVLAADRKTGASAAYAPLSTALFDTSNDLDMMKVTDASGDLVTEVDSWTLDVNLNVKAKEVQGTNGAIGHKHGKFEPGFALDAYFNDSDQIAAINDNRNVKLKSPIGNHQGGFALRMPYAALRGGDQEYAANEAVTLKGDVPGFRDPDTNVVMELTRFPYMPFGGS